MGEGEEQRTSSSLGTALQKGSQLAAVVVGAGVGILNPFAGAVVRFAANEALQRLGAEVMGRVGHRAAVRAGAAVILIEEDAREREASGDRLREDGFFEPNGDLRSDRDELLEGMLRRAAETYEERKLQYISHIYSSAAYNDRFRLPEAMFSLGLADRLIYRQFVALASFIESDKGISERVQANLESGPKAPAIDAELQALGDNGLLGTRIREGDIGRADQIWDSSHAHSVLTPLGLRCVEVVRKLVEL